MLRMEDIAKLAGVSKSAVSIAFSGKPGIADHTRERILAIAREHGYQAKTRQVGNESAGGVLTFLVFANSGIVLEHYYQQPFFRELIHHIEERCRNKGHSLMFSTVHIESFRDELRALAQDNRTDGYILLGTNLNRSHIKEVSELLGPNLVVLDNCYDTLPVHFVEINNFMGAYQAGAFLLDQGHREIGYLASNGRIHNFDERQHGFLHALSERGIALDPDYRFSIAPTMLSSQEELMRQFARLHQKGRSLPTALFCECDYMAISATKTLAEMGLRIPGDMSLVGFDNIPESQIVSPELTTVHVEKQRMANLAVDLMIETLGKPDIVRTKLKVDTRFVERASSRPQQSVQSNVAR